jgi:hypothetical protein
VARLTSRTGTPRAQEGGRSRARCRATTTATPMSRGRQQAIRHHSERRRGGGRRRGFAGERSPPVSWRQVAVVSSQEHAHPRDEPDPSEVCFDLRSREDRAEPKPALDPAVTRRNHSLGIFA